MIYRSTIKILVACLGQGSLTMEKSSREGWWDCEDPDTFFKNIYKRIEKCTKN